MNVASMLGDVVKCKHIKDKYKYLVKGTVLWFVLMYDSDDETAVVNESFSSEKDARYRFNHIG